MFKKSRPNRLFSENYSCTRKFTLYYSFLQTCTASNITPLTQCFPRLVECLLKEHWGPSESPRYLARMLLKGKVIALDPVDKGLCTLTYLHISFNYQCWNREKELIGFWRKRIWMNKKKISPSDHFPDWKACFLLTFIFFSIMVPYKGPEISDGDWYVCSMSLFPSRFRCFLGLELYLSRDCHRCFSRCRSWLSRMLWMLPYIWTRQTPRAVISGWLDSNGGYRRRADQSGIIKTDLAEFYADTGEMQDTFAKYPEGIKGCDIDVTESWKAIWKWGAGGS